MMRGSDSGSGWGTSGLTRCLLRTRRAVGAWLLRARSSKGDGEAAPAGGLLAQSLYAIALKSELAAELLAADPSGANKELQEIAVLARAAVSGGRLRLPDPLMSELHVEVAGAAALLAAAGIEVRADVKAVDLPPGVARVLVGTIREGALAVLRHSDATTCSIIGGRSRSRVWLAVSNDGAHPGAEDAPGLRRLGREAHELAGTVSILCTPDHHFRLLVELPEEAS
jgi:two-component system sensor histidine kinase DesK